MFSIVGKLTGFLSKKYSGGSPGRNSSQRSKIFSTVWAIIRRPRRVAGCLHNYFFNYKSNSLFLTWEVYSSGRGTCPLQHQESHCILVSLPSLKRILYQEGYSNQVDTTDNLPHSLLPALLLVVSDDVLGPGHLLGGGPHPSLLLPPSLPLTRPPSSLSHDDLWYDFCYPDPVIASVVTSDSEQSLPNIEFGTRRGLNQIGLIMYLKVRCYISLKFDIIL